MLPLHRTPHERFDQLCHDVNNPLMIISGHTYLLTRILHRLPGHPGRERQQAVTNLARIAEEIQAVVAWLDAYRAALVAGGETPLQPRPAAIGDGPS